MQQFRLIHSHFNTDVMKAIVSCEIHNKIDQLYNSDLVQLCDVLKMNNFGYYPLTKSLNEKFLKELDQMNLQ